MASGTFVAYYRVSTSQQGRSGLGLEAQRAATHAYLNGGDWALLGEYREVESGKRDDRPQLRKAIDHCRMTGARLLIAKLDRLSRDPDFIGQLLKSEVQFTAVDMPDATETVIRIMSVIAQEERRAISARTKAALAAAKARGVKLGNPQNLANQEAGSKAGNARKTAMADDYAKRVAAHIADAQRSGASSLRDIANVLNSRGFKTSRGAAWGPVQVRRVLSRVNS